MSEEQEEDKLKLIVPTITTQSASQTNSYIVSKTPEQSEETEMEGSQNMSIRKRRNLSKNRAQATRQREKTPEPGRTSIPHEDTTTSDDEDFKPNRTSREIEADNTYEEMKRLVQEKANIKDPVYDLNTDEILEARAYAATERRRRSISPFALPGKDESTILERKGSFIDPTNKLLSTSYAITPKDEDKARRNSLTFEPTVQRKSSLSPPTTSSPKDKEPPYPIPTTPKKLEEIIYPDEIIKAQKAKTPTTIENPPGFDDKQDKRNSLTTPKSPETPTLELITKVIQLERSPSRKLNPENKPIVEVRERVVRTPSRKLNTESKPVVVKQQPTKQTKEESQSKAPPVKPARSKSSSRFGGKTSESEMSEDQVQLQNTQPVDGKRKAVPTPRRFFKNKSPRADRSKSLHRTENLNPNDSKTTNMSQTSQEILELMQKARARSLSIPKDDPRLPSAYKKSEKNLQSPLKEPSTPIRSRGISCPKTIQIISDQEILSGLSKSTRASSERNYSRQSSGYVDASQSEYTSSCYSSSPSENEFDFDLSERTAELTRKLNILSDEVNKRHDASNIILSCDNFQNVDSGPKSVLRKRSITDNKQIRKKNTEPIVDEVLIAKILSDREKKVTTSKWRLIANWQTFKSERKVQYYNIKMLFNKCICNILMLIIMCGLGGILFKSLEGSFESVYKCGSRGVKRDFIESLWRGSHYLREEDWKSLARKKLYEFEDQLHTAHEAGVTSHSGQRSWNFMNSFVYCLTLVTTIGYGHIAPKTTSGRVATIVYAIVGIPLFLIVLADFGKLFTRIIKFFWAFIRRFYYTRSCRKVRRTVPMQEVMKGLNIMYDAVRRPSQLFNEDEILKDDVPPHLERKPSDDPPPLPPKPNALRDPEIRTEPETPAPSVFEIDDEFNLPISVAIIILIIYIIIGATGYSLWEPWTFFDSFYFVFISMSTIGLGDLVPNHPMFMIASILYLVFGLALTSMCINVVQVKLSDTFRQASAKLGATIGLKVAEEDGSLVPDTPKPIEIVPVHKPTSETKEYKADTNDDDAKNR